MDCSKFEILKSFSRVPPPFLSVQDTPKRQYAINVLKHTITIVNKEDEAPKCRMKSRNGNIKKTKRSFNEQKVQIRIQKCLRLFRLRSSEKYKKTVCKLSFTCARRVVQGKDYIGHN